MQQDLCNAIVKKGPKRHICEKTTGHARGDDREHVETTYIGGEMQRVTWTDSPMGGETAREV